MQWLVGELQNTSYYGYLAVICQEFSMLIGEFKLSYPLQQLTCVEHNSDQLIFHGLGILSRYRRYVCY